MYKKKNKENLWLEDKNMEDKREWMRI